MFILLAVLGTIAAIVGAVIYESSNDSKVYTPAEYVKYIGLAFSILGFILAFFLAIPISQLSVIDEKISMYQEENTKIEEQIATMVKQYQEYETDIFESVTPESAMTLVTLYPELKSDTLVQKQIEVYVYNNERIKELKEEKIGGSVLRWWVYFGE